MPTEESAPTEASAQIWYHTIEFPDGTHTPGWFDTRAAPQHVVWPSALQGGRCLDVGTFDGFWAFEMERRGAGEVFAIDVDDPEELDFSYDQKPWAPKTMVEWKNVRGPGFAEAAAKLGSKVQRINKSVYKLDPEVDGKFDVVLCGALLLHLRDPILALERMREVCRGEVLLIESLDGPLDLLARRIPAARLAGNWDQWWRVNSAGLRRMMELAGLEIAWTGKRFLVPFGPGAPARFHKPRLESLAAGKPRGKGVLFQAVRGRPRPPIQR